MLDNTSNFDQMMFVFTNDMPFDERPGLLKRESLFLSDRNETFDSSATTASYESSLVDSFQVEDELIIEKKNVTCRPLPPLVEELYNKEDSSVPTALGTFTSCEPAHLKYDLEAQSTVDTIDTDSTDNYTHFPKKRDRIRSCAIDFCISSSEQSTSPSIFLDVVGICQGWLTNASGDGQNTVLVGEKISVVTRISKEITHVLVGKIVSRTF
jgi:hypothetical protein